MELDYSFLPVMGGAVIAFYGIARRIEGRYLRWRARAVIRAEFEVIARRKR